MTSGDDQPDDAIARANRFLLEAERSEPAWIGQKRAEKAAISGMPLRHYRVYSLDQEGRIDTGMDAECGGDPEAVAWAATAFAPDTCFEVWEGQRRVFQYDPVADRAKRLSPQSAAAPALAHGILKPPTD